MAETIVNIPLSKLHEPHILLRPVRKGTVEYLELRDSIAVHGLTNSLLARPHPSKPGEHEVVDGFWRYNCLKELGIPTAPCIVKELTDREVLELQLQSNAIRPTTKPCDFAKHLRRILRDDPDMSMPALAAAAGKSTVWVKNQLSLLNLKPLYQKAVDRGEMSCSNAYALAKLPTRYQDDYAEAALSMPSKEFTQLIADVVRRVMEEVRNGKLHRAFVADFQPVAHIRSLNNILRERSDIAAAPVVLSQVNAETALDGWRAALDWVVHLDPTSVEEQRERAAERLKTSLTRSDSYVTDT